MTTIKPYALSEHPILELDESHLESVSQPHTPLDLNTTTIVGSDV